MTDCRVKDAINSHVIPAPSLQKPFSSSAFLLVRWGNTVCSLTWLPPATLWLRCSNWKITSDLICVSGCDKLAVLSFWAQWYLLASSSKQLLKKKKKKDTLLCILPNYKQAAGKKLNMIGLSTDLNFSLLARSLITPPHKQCLKTSLNTALY